ncbi:MAG TPA: hypothetical protein VNM69_17955 [Bacillus sp. (in: firmicutes)]|nr:hypothetical protein [Bacillus sp. (in: firmicutes)]
MSRKLSESEIKKLLDLTKAFKEFNIDDKFIPNDERVKEGLEVLEKAISDIEIDEKLLDNLINSEDIPKKLFSIPPTKFPNNLVIPKDKVSNKLFEGKLIKGEWNQIATEGKASKKELTAVVAIDFDELKEIEVSRTLTAYDREVHDAIVSLYVDGENEYITPLMIYRTMTGNPRVDLKANSKQYQAIIESIEKCSDTKIKIDAQNEAKAFNLDKLIYEGRLINSEKITGIHKGKVNEWIHILRKPVLYDYADGKGQIDRPDISLLNTPVNKNEETIILQGYLLRRIRTMKHSKMSRNILYETIYKQLNVQAASASALRKKQTKIRNTVKEILDYWIKEKEIKGYKENKGKNNAIVSLTISVD